MNAVTTQKPLEGLGGWLVLVGIGLVLSPLRLLMEMVPIYADVFGNGVFGMLLDPDGAAYNPKLAALLVVEIGINVLMIAGAVIATVLFFMKHPVFPKVFIAFHLVTLVLIVADALAVGYLIPDQPTFDPDTMKEIVREVAACAIWIPYMLVSKRVKNTFVRKDSGAVDPGAPDPQPVVGEYQVGAQPGRDAT